MHGQRLGLPGRWIATHSVVAYLQVELVVLNLRVQPRGDVESAIPRSITGSIDMQTALAGSSVWQAQRVEVVNHDLAGATIQCIFHGEGLCLPRRRIATHGGGIDLQVKLVILNLRVQPRGNVQGAISRSIRSPIDVQTVLADSYIGEAQCIAIIDDGLVSASVQHILNGEDLVLPGSRIAAHAAGIDGQNNLTVPNL